MQKRSLMVILACSLCLADCGGSSGGANNGGGQDGSPGLGGTLGSGGSAGSFDGGGGASEVFASDGATSAPDVSQVIDGATSAVDTAQTIDSVPSNVADGGGSGNNDAAKDGSSSDSCPNLAGAYTLTTEIVSTTCRLGLHTITQPIVFTFTQTAPSCTFKMTNSIYAASKYTGHFVMVGSKAKVIWDSVDPAPTQLGYALTYTSEDLTITPGATPATSTIVGSFVWHISADCDGTTNVCNGAVPAGCPTPQ